jgi:hypothetical protein
MQYAALKRRSTSAWLHDATSQKTLNFISPSWDLNFKILLSFSSVTSFRVTLILWNEASRLFANLRHKSLHFHELVYESLFRHFPQDLRFKIISLINTFSKCSIGAISHNTCRVKVGGIPVTVVPQKCDEVEKFDLCGKYLEHILTVRRYIRGNWGSVLEFFSFLQFSTNTSSSVIAC